MKRGDGAKRDARWGGGLFGGGEITKIVKGVKKVGLEFGGFRRKPYFCAALPKND